MLTGHPIFWLFIAAVAAPLLAQIPLGFKIPVVVLEVVLGILIGPHVLGLAYFEPFIAQMFTFAMAATLFMAGMELDFGEIKGRPLNLALSGWAISLVLAIAIVAALHRIPSVLAPLSATIALCTTSVGVLVPIFKDNGQLATPFGHLVIAAGTVGEVAPVIAMSLLLSQRYSTWQEMGFLIAFLVIVGTAIAVGIGERPPRVLNFLGRQMHASSQLPVRICLLILAGLFVLAHKFGFESIFGAFAAGMIVGQATRGEEGKPLREKMDAVCYGWFYPFFFVGAGVHFDVSALLQSPTTMLLVPAILILFLLIRGVPVLIYRNAIARDEQLPFALSSAVPSLSIIVVITEISVRATTMTPELAAALISAALLSLMLFPTIAGVLLAKKSKSN